MGSPDEDWGLRPNLQRPDPHLRPWKPGVYLALLLPGGRRPSQPQSALGTATSPSAFLFVVRAAVPGAKACNSDKLPLFTYQA